MNKYQSLTKLQLKDFISRYQSGLNLRKGNMGKILLVLVGGLLLYPSFLFSQILYTPLAQAGFPHILITLGYIAVSMIMLVTAIPFILSIFFYSRDTAFLSSLPIRESTIVFSKLSAMYLYLLGLSGLVFGPVLGIYLVNSTQIMGVLIPSALVFLLSPILPLVLATIIIMPLMRFVGASKRRNLFTILGNLVLFITILVMQSFLTRLQTHPEAMEQLLLQSDGLLRVIGRTFPPSIWVTKMITGSLVDAILFLGINILTLLVLFMLSKIIFRRAVQAFNQQSSVSIKEGSIYYKKRSVGYQLIRRHILIITTNPAFFLNTFLVMLVPVIIFFTMLFTGEASFEMLHSPMLNPIKPYIFTGIAASPAILGSLSATAITREGKSFWETKALPIRTEDNIRYRIITSILISLAGTLLLSIVSQYLLRLPLLDLLLGILTAILATLFFMHIDIVINIYRPFLDWTNPTAAVKNNLNVMISLAIRVATAGLLYPIFLILKGMDPKIFFIAADVFFLVLFIIARKMIYGRLVHKFNQIL